MMSPDIIEKLGALSLASRFRRISEELVRQVEAIYQSRGIDISPREFPVLVFLSGQSGPVPISAIAEALRVSHPAAVQTVEVMKRGKTVDVTPSPSDQRQRLISLSRKGRKEVEKAKPVWKKLNDVMKELIAEKSPELLNNLSSLERDLAKNPLIERFNSQEISSPAKIINWDPAYSANFKDLNLWWIEKYFGKIEPSDIKQLNTPQETILKGSGMIFFAKIDGTILGTCAVVEHGENFELCKMAVSPFAQGKGLGKLLLKHAIQYCREHGAKKVTLESNTKLESAISLYRKFGFKECEVNSTYERVNIAMELYLEKEPVRN